MRLSPWFLVTVMVVGGCVKVRVVRRADANAASVVVADARASLVAADSALSAASGGSFAGAMRAVLDERAIVLLPNAPTANGGGDAIAAIERVSNGDLASMRWRTLLGEVSADGRFGYSFGRGARRTATGDSALAGYLAVWRRANGTAPWRVVAWVLTGGGNGAVPPSCTPPSGVTSARTSRAAATREAFRADSQFAHDAETRGAEIAFRAWSAPHGSMVGVGDAPVCGPAAIGAALEGTPIGGVRWHPIAGDAAESGDLAFTVGHATWTTGPSPRYVHYLTVWQRMPDGSWKFVSDAGNPTVSPGAAR